MKKKNSNACIFDFCICLKLTVPIFKYYCYLYLFIVQYFVINIRKEKITKYCERKRQKRTNKKISINY